MARFPGDDAYLSRLSGGILVARGAGIPVIYVTGSFRPGHPEVTSRNLMFAAAAAAGRFVQELPKPASTPQSVRHPVISLSPGRGSRRSPAATSPSC
jgi:hypothetical protein